MKKIFISFFLLALSLSATRATAQPDYAVPAPEANVRSNATGRLVMELDVTGGTVNGVAQNFHSVVNQDGENWWDKASQTEVYKDMTSETLEVSAGDKLHFDIMKKDLEWMHFYVYIDYNHDGEFDVNTELVSYSYLNGLDSNGLPVEGNTLILPDFFVKDNAPSVTTRMRFKVDWDSNDPTGNKASDNLIGNNSGSILDYTIQIHGQEKPVQQYPVYLDNDLISDGYILATDAEGTEIHSGDQVNEGTELHLSIVDADPAYAWSSYLINDEFYYNDTYVVTGPTEISAEFTYKYYAVHFTEDYEGGELLIFQQQSNGTSTQIHSGDKMPYYTELLVKATPSADYELVTILLNGQPIELINQTLQVNDDAAVDGVISLSAEFFKEPTYSVPSESDNVRDRNDRRLETLTFEGATLDGVAHPFEFTLNNDPQPTVYMDETSSVFEATAGDQINVSWTFRTNTEWTHYYLYIDYNHDGVFDEDTELVSYTFYSDDDFDGVNSLGEVIPASQKGKRVSALPVFTIPADLVDTKTRMRFKSDWNSKNPNGNPTQSIGKNGGTIVDFTIDIHEAKVASEYAVNFETTLGGRLEVRSIDNGWTIDSGDMLQYGEQIAVNMYPLEGYDLTSVLVNGVERVNDCEFDGKKFVLPLTVQRELNISVAYEAMIQSHTLTYECTEGGYIEVFNVQYDEFPSGSEVAYGTEFMVEAYANEGYKVKEILLNGVPYDSYFFIMGDEDMHIKVIFEQDFEGYAVNFEYTQGGTVEVQSLDTGSLLESGDKVAKNDKVYVTMTENLGYKLTSVLVNGSERKYDCNHSGSKYVLPVKVKGDINIVVTFESEKATYTMTCESNQGGVACLLDSEGYPISNGDSVLEGVQNVSCAITVFKNFEIESVLVNGEEMKDFLIYDSVDNKYILKFEPIMSDTYVQVTFVRIETGIAEATLAEVSYNGAAQTLNIPAGATAAVYSAAGQQVMSVEGGQTVSTANLATGAYVVRVANEAGVKVIKFIKK